MRISAACPLGGRTLNVAERLEAARRAFVLTESVVRVSSIVALSDGASHGEAVLGAVAGRAASCEVPSGRVWSGTASDVVCQREASGGWTIPECLAEILLRGLEPGMSVEFSGSVLVGLLPAGIASGSGAWSIFLGMPSMGWDAAGSPGVNASRTVCVPKMGDVVRTQALTAAVDGFGVVAVGFSICLGARERRLLSKRAAVRGSLLLEEGWDHRDHVRGEVVAIEGVDRGVGHVRALFMKATSGWYRV